MTYTYRIEWQDDDDNTEVLDHYGARVEAAISAARRLSNKNHTIVHVVSVKNGVAVGEKVISSASIIRTDGEGFLLYHKSDKETKSCRC